MQIRVDDQTVLRAPATVIERAAAAGVAIDPAAPNWIATDERGLRILRYLDGRTPRGEVVRQYADDSGLDLARAWLHVDTFTRDALRQRFISTDGAVPVPYLAGRHTSGLTAFGSSGSRSTTSATSPASIASSVLASFLGMLPGTALWVYLGSLAPAAAELSSASNEGGSVRTVLYVAGLAATAGAAFIGTRAARRALNAELQESAAS